MQAPTLKMLDQLHKRITRLEARALCARAGDFADREQRRAKVVHTLPRRNAARLEDLCRTHSLEDKFRDYTCYDWECDWECDSDSDEIDEADIVWSAADDFCMDTPHHLTSTQLGFLETIVNIYLRQVVSEGMPPQDLAYLGGMKDFIAEHLAAITAITRPGFPLNSIPVKAILKDLWPGPRSCASGSREQTLPPSRTRSSTH